MRVIVTKDYKEMSLMAADIIRAQVLLKPDCVLGLATGSSPIGTYEYLADYHKRGLLDFSNVKAANLDEYRGLSKDHDQSYAYFMKKNLFMHINIKAENCNIPDGSNPDSAAEAQRYDKKILELGGVDLQLLGIGHNGHIGFNEPADAFSDGTHCVTLTESTIDANARFFASKDDVPTQAYTMGTGTIMRAKRVLLIASGSGKADAVYGMVKGPIVPSCPASVLQLHPDCILIADREAAGKL